MPVAHWVWGPGGWIAKMGGLDFAGGLVVHMTSGYAALVCALFLGNRKDFSPQESTSSFSAMLVLLGGSLLWFGWFGFNAGSALAASELAGQAAATTFFSACAAMTAWTVLDWVLYGRPTAVGASVGSVAVLVAIPPAAGYVNLPASIVIGLLAAAACHAACRIVKVRLKTDDTVDVFACHGVGGTIGTILTAIFATTTINPAGANGLLFGGTKLFFANCLGALAVIIYTMAMTWLVLKIVSKFTDLRVSEEEEREGLDATQHGERVFSFRR
jgi:Amt family ammonium transporter